MEGLRTEGLRMKGRRTTGATEKKKYKSKQWRVCKDLVTTHEFRLVIGFIKSLQIVNAGNENPLANSRSRLITTALIRSWIFSISCCLVADPNTVLFCSRRYRLATASQVTHMLHSQSESESESESQSQSQRQRQSYFTTGCLR
jgi:hypothetical protein